MDALAKFLNTQGISQSELARRLGTSRQLVSHWLAGAKPSVYYTLALDVVTGGAVPPSSWLTGTQRLALVALAGQAAESGS